MQRGSAATVLLVLIALSGCIGMEAHADLYRDKSMDFTIAAHGFYPEGVSALKEQFLKEYGNSTGQMLKEDNKSFVYRWEGVRFPEIQGAPSITMQGAELKMNMTRTYEFPLGYTYRIEMVSAGMGNNGSRNISDFDQYLAETMGYDFYLNPFGTVTDTNGARRYDGAVKFDFTMNNRYFVEFEDYIWNHAMVSEACQERWRCTEWTTCSNGVQRRDCQPINTCEDYIKRPDEQQVCGPDANGIEARMKKVINSQTP